MTQESDQEYAGIASDANDPEVDELKIISANATSMDNCDSATQWSIVSGSNGITLSVDGSSMVEGNACVMVNIPAGNNGTNTVIVKCTCANNGSWNMADGTTKFIKIYLRDENLYGNAANSIVLYFGKNNYNEQSKTSLTMSPEWLQYPWDISAVANANKNAITQFGIAYTYLTGANARKVYIDKLLFDDGYARARGNDGDRVFQFYPHTYSSNYIGTGANQTIQIPRKGQPNRIDVMSVGANGKIPVSWMGNAWSNYSLGMDGTVASNGIRQVTDGSFVVGTWVRVNSNGEQFLFTAFWDD